MAATTRESRVLLGRSAELGTVDEAISHARGGRSRVLVVRGEAGVGKTALLEYALERAQGFGVLRATGLQSESDLPFAGLDELLRPALSYVDDLPGPQAVALRGALGLAATFGADRFLVSAAVLSLLAAASERAPLLCLIDDAQWLDQPSADALVFAARRMQAEPILLLLGVRGGEPGRFEAHALPELELTGLDDAAARQLLAEGAPLAPDVARRLLAEAAGNPLALIELPTSLSDAQRNGIEPLPDVLPLTPRLERLFRRRIAALPDETRSALLIAAADNSADLAAILRAAAEVGLAADCFDAAEQARLVRLADGELVFQHPLVRSAVYDGAPLSARRRAHEALAEVFVGDQHADRRAWHRSRATVAGDEDAVAALEALGHRAQRRAAHASAASAFLRAAELTDDDVRKASALTAAAEAAWDGGQPERARQLVEQTLQVRGADPDARLLHLRGVIESRHGDLPDALPLFLAAAGASDDISLTLQSLSEATEVAVDVGSRSRIPDIGRRAQSIDAVTPVDRFTRAVVTGFGFCFGHDDERSRAALFEALDLAATLPDDARVQRWAAHAASTGLEVGSGLPFTARTVELVRSQGRVGLLPVVLAHHALELFWNSRFDAAYGAATEGYELARDTGQGWGWHVAVLAQVEAVRGREADSRARAGDVLAYALGTRRAFLATFARSSLGLLELSSGRADAAVEVLLETVGTGEDLHPVIAARALPDVVEAIARSGAPRTLAAEPMARLHAWVEQHPTETRRALLARCDALVGDGRPAEEAFAEAVALSQALVPFEQARTALVYGEWLRRQRRRRDARGHLRTAAELFRSLGATPWEARAEAELRATGETAHRRDPASLTELTPQELQIARLVAEGLTNRDVAAQLYLSPRTIEHHLRKVFTKLGIASRAELIRNRAELLDDA